MLIKITDKFHDFLKTIMCRLFTMDGEEIFMLIITIFLTSVTFIFLMLMIKVAWS